MIVHVPVLEFLHELRSAGMPLDYWDVVLHPDRYWEALSPDRRARVLLRLGVDTDADAVSGLSVVRRRGRTPTDENVFVRVNVGNPNPLTRTRNALFYRTLEVPDLGEDETEDFQVSPEIFEHGTSDAPRVSILEQIDAAWEAEPYDPDVDGALCELEAPPGYREIERYWVEEPFALVGILRDDENQTVYHVQEPELTELERSILATLNERLRDALVLEDAGEPAERSAFLLSKVFELLRLFRHRVDARTAYKLGYFCLRNYLGFARLEPIMRDPNVEDVSCNGPDLPVFVAHGTHQNLRTNLVFDELELNSFTIKLAQRGGKLLSVAQPLVDATLPDGSRIQASLGREVTSRGSTFTIRKFREDPLTAVDLIRSGSHTLDTMAFLWLAVELNASLVVMGATASGKTTTLNTLSQFIPPQSKIVSIEDTREITLQHENWLAGVTRDSFSGAESEKITMYELLRAALRQRPEYILVGEIRGQEGLTLFQAMSTGHTCFSTMHAGSVENAVHRLENPPISVPRVMLTSLDFLIHQGQVDVDGKPARRMISLTEVNGIDHGSRNLRMNEVFHWDGADDRIAHASSSYVLDRVRAERGWSRSRLNEELAARRGVLEGLLERNERHYRDVARAIRVFYHRRDGEDEDGDAPSGAKPVSVNAGDGAESA